MVINRDLYVRQMAEGEGNHLIKIITGIRRCGKSFLLFKLFVNYMVNKGVQPDHIIRVDLEDIRNIKLRNPLELVNYIDFKMTDNERYYILLDEVQHVPDFVDVLNSYLKIENADLYVTGSNSKFLSSDIVTEFRGRGDEIHVSPLSFSEYYQTVGGDKQEAWRDYITYGGLPQILELAGDSKKSLFLKNLYQTVYKKDLEERNRISKSFEFDELVEVMASSIGSPCNPPKLSNTFKLTKQVDLSPHTIALYLDYLEDAFMIEKSLRYDVKGKKYINTLAKYYFSDLGLRNAILDFRQLEETHIMENVVYNELRRQGYSVDVGMVEVRQKDAVTQQWKRKQLEVDFVAHQANRLYYIQSALSMPDEEKRLQESASLRQIQDNFKKIIIVKDYTKPRYDANGILIVNLFDFLLKPEVLQF
jgi:predicted AAA+ superfamily ATPase